MPFDLDAALENTVRIGASDLHVKVAAVPRVRVAGRLVDLPGSSQVTPEDADSVRDTVVTAPAKRSELDEYGSTDASYGAHGHRFRATAFTQRGFPSFVFRAVPDAPDAGELGLPGAVAGWGDEKRGLVVVTGPTGSGKSTTCAAIIDRINQTRDCHILTIEDPIEFLHEDKRAIVCQREIGHDAPSYHVALRAAMRQDPDVIMVGEVRDEETAMTALRAAETGHLVVCTMHTIDASDTIQRFVDFFGEQRGPLARQMLAGTLVGVCSQRLIPRIRGGMALNAEVLVNTSRIQDLITEGMSVSEVHKALKEGDFYGMQSFDQSLLELVREGSVSQEDALSYSSSPNDFRLSLQQADVDGLASVGPA
ncbi:MAG TPA: PilT/PilU family type 4a pilus ATPase [Thermoleophilaceae bacterium]|nr:PilT/PilU family type 4a pilus ATPase [Thermoleophilaceae bacterium]